MALTIRGLYHHLVLDIQSMRVPSFFLNSQKTVLLLLTFYFSILISCRFKHFVLLLHLLSLSTVPSPGNAFDFSSLEPNPPGRIVPYKPVYKSVHFEANSRYQPPSSLASMKRKSNRHSLKHASSATISTSTASPPPLQPPKEYTFVSLSPFYESYESVGVSSSSRFEKDHDPSRGGSSSRRVSKTRKAGSSVSRHSQTKSVTPLGAPFGALSTYPNQFDQFGGSRKNKNYQSLRVNNGQSVRRSAASESALSPINSMPSQLISTPFKSRLKADNAKSDYMSDTSEIISGSLFASTPFNDSFSAHYRNSDSSSASQQQKQQQQQPKLIPYDSVYLDFDNHANAPKKSAKRQKGPSVEGTSENDDLFDYASEEDAALDSSEQGARANGMVNANRFVNADYLSQEDEPPTLMDSYYSPLHSAHSLVHSLHQDAQMRVAFSSQESAPSASVLSGGRKARLVVHIAGQKTANITWPVKKVAEIPGDITLGGLMMVHEREDKQICGPIMPQGGIQALEAMLHTIDYVNSQHHFLPGIKLGAKLLDDCDKDTYGLEQSIDFIKGMFLY